jgi:hypothetical protein
VAWRCVASSLSLELQLTLHCTGSGSYKFGSNYGPNVHPAMAAAEQGYQQILWLNGEDIGEVRFPSFSSPFTSGSLTL